MDLKAEGWIHNFNVTDSLRHRGYTIYKITSIVFPRYIPEALSCITLWKRFSDIKKLYKEICKKHKDVPPIVDSSYFKRFDPEIVDERKNYILKLLNFIAEHPVLYKSQAFQKFFETGITPDCSPQKNNNIASICSDLAIPIQPDIVLIDPSRDSDDDAGDAEQKADDSMLDSFISMSSASTIRSVPEIVIVGSENGNLEQDRVDGAEKPPSEGESMEVENEPDYVFEAAMQFSRAVESEANADYKEAFDRYKIGIDILLNGAKTDLIASRKKMVKEKACKYLAKAEEIYDKFVANQDENEILEITTEVLDDRGSQSLNDTKMLERQKNYLSKYKVVKIIDSIMQVQDVTDKQCYVMKAIPKPSSNLTIFLPQKVLYMVPLVAYFQSEMTVFLLLKLVCGGKLWDYICTYSTSTNPEISTFIEKEDVVENHHHLQMNGNFIKMETSVLSPIKKEAGYDSGFVNLLLDYNKNASKSETDAENSKKLDVKEQLDQIEIAAENIPTPFIPSFDTLSKDMDVTDLVNCSQQLLRSVSDTLEQSKSAADVQEVLRNVEIEEIQPKSSQLFLSRCNVFSNKEKKKVVVISNDELLPEGCVKRWASELIMAVDSLHYNGIICGDLAMDNLLLGSEGQIMLTYFYRKNKSHKVPVNTPKQKAIDNLYVAPERPLTQKSDWWSVGVILFEMLTKKKFLSCHPAFIACYNEVQYPEVEISEEAKDLLGGLLQLDPDNRFDFKDIAAHQFFESIDWKDVQDKGRM